MSTPIYAARWWCGGALIRPSAKIVQSICDFNSLCSFGGSNFNILICVSTLVTAVVLFRYHSHTGYETGAESLHPTSFHDHSRRISSRAHTPRRMPVLWQASRDSTLRLLSQPAWNDARGEILAYVYPYEIIFVNDCSPDNSLAVIQSISANDLNVLGISHSRNFGSQMTFRSGMELATTDAVVFLDGDLQDPPELIADFYAQWEAGYDVIYGRHIQREMPWGWEVLYKTFYRILAAFSYIPIPQDAGDFSLIDKKVMAWVLVSNERDLFLRGLRAYMGFKQTGVDYVSPERMFGVSTNNFIKNLNWAKMAFFSYINAPLNLLSTSGVVLTIAVVLCMVLTIIVRIFFPEFVPQGVTTVLLMVLFFGSINLLGIAVLGEYIGKIIIEVKQHPRLIRSAIVRNGIINADIPNESQR